MCLETDLGWAHEQRFVRQHVSLLWPACHSPCIRRLASPQSAAGAQQCEHSPSCRSRTTIQAGLLKGGHQHLCHMGGKGVHLCSSTIRVLSCGQTDAVQAGPFKGGLGKIVSAQ